MRRLHLTDRLDGPPFALPGLLDRASDKWWSLPPRLRLAMAASVVCLLVIGVPSRAATSPYGSPVDVLVASRDLRAGHRIDAQDLRRATWPDGLVPDGAVTVAEGRLSAPLPSGSILTDRHITRDGIADQIAGDGAAAVPLPRELLPELVPGQRLDVIGQDLQGTSVVLARQARTLSSDESHTWVAVARDDAPDVAAAAAAARLTVVVLAP